MGQMSPPYILPQQAKPREQVTECSADFLRHTAAVHWLLHWPSISVLMERAGCLEQMEGDYVMNQEESKGVLRVYGRGEGKNTWEEHQPSAGICATSFTSIQCEDVGAAEARGPASSSEGLWGTDLDIPNVEPSSTDDLASENHFKLDPRTLYRLLQSYLENIHILHPFLDKDRLTRVIGHFSARYNPNDQNLTNTLFFESAMPSITIDNPQRLSRSPSDAIVLLIMALGKICEWKDPLPGPVPEHWEDTSAPSSVNSSSNTLTNYSPLPSPTSFANSMSAPGSRSSIKDDSASSGRRNIDVIPGLAYYARATDILGNVQGSMGLTNMQANILASLYTSQLARTFDTWSWIQSACRIGQYLVQRSTSAKKRGLTQRDSFKFAFWTCSQLESDLWTELDLPRSGIQNIKLDYSEVISKLTGEFNQMNYQASNVSGTAPLTMTHYLFQFHIHNSLSNMQKDLSPSETRQRNINLFNIRDIQYHFLQKWRYMLPSSLQWTDGDSPSSDIKDARLRADYYGALCLIHRPFLSHLLNGEVIAQLESYEFNVRGKIPDLAKTCVDAAVKSTVAFDGIIKYQRLIVPNIFGTAHA